MDFGFSDEQIALRDQARRVLTARDALGAARRVTEAGLDHDAALWGEIRALGWPAITIPERHGGLGLGPVDLCVVAEELGRSLAPTPFATNLYLAAEALMLDGASEAAARWLPLLAAGEASGTVAIAEGRGELTPEALATRIDGTRIDGVKVAAPDGLAADFALVLARDAAAGGASLALVELGGKGVCRQPEATIDPSRGHAELRFAGAPCTVLGRAGDGWGLWNRLRDRAAVPFAFEAIGGAQACLEAAIGWARERHTFGRPIGSYQAIKHTLADMFVAIELARSNAYYAAWALSVDAPQLTGAAASARIAATDAFWLAARENLQIHGGLGFTHESDCHLFYRRAKLLAVNLGGPRFWRARLAGEIMAGRAELER
ncbi:MAG: acyl-CoA dehydrogenase [Caulobacter sp.]|nr:acyl-CoA dehydrogenase [Caulobacter sp.]